MNRYFKIKKQPPHIAKKKKKISKNVKTKPSIISCFKKQKRKKREEPKKKRVDFEPLLEIDIVTVINYANEYVHKNLGRSTRRRRWSKRQPVR